MIKTVNEMVKELRENMRNGKGQVEVMHIFNKDEMKGKVRMFAKVTIEPGCSIGMHEHVDEEEVYYIINGTATVNDNGNIKEVKAGDAVITGGGASHSIENTGNTTLEMIAVVFLYV